MEIKQFESQFVGIQPQLRSYLYRLCAHRETAEDLAQDTFVKAQKSLGTFKGSSTLKTWVFSIATNLARDQFRVQKRFADDAQDQCKAEAGRNPATKNAIAQAYLSLPEQQYQVKEHLNYCFTCMAKTLPLEGQVAVILADIYQFKRKEIGEILGRTEGVVKHLLFEGRQSLQKKYEYRCALVNKKGVCYQCKEIADHFNTHKNAQAQVDALSIVQEKEAGPEHLLQLRAALVREIDPLDGNASNLLATLFEITQTVGEKKD